MSLIGGNSAHPESVVAIRTSTGAPHRGQLAAPASLVCPHHGQRYARLPDVGGMGVVLMAYSV
jgi:hypothetical protein